MKHLNKIFHLETRIRMSLFKIYIENLFLMYKVYIYILLLRMTYEMNFEKDLSMTLQMVL